MGPLRKLSLKGMTSSSKPGTVRKRVLGKKGERDAARPRIRSEKPRSRIARKRRKLLGEGSKRWGGGIRGKTGKEGKQKTDNRA